MIEAIKRIKEMEALFDFLLSVPKSEAHKFKKERDMLISYYESKLWRYDFELDEKGLLPSDLKRGVLSEDGIYNYISEE
ncbi:MAG: DUF4298 domain-containing protein [Ruminococcaceae bacterium]|nr:DUF4298 domain-containing protein [Oscillospiraceae bacterium]